jgi:predicted aspartyl protease
MEKYDFGFSPPAPAILVKIKNPLKTESEKSKTALIDSGAFMTVIPDDLIEALKLVPAGETDAGGYKGPKQRHRTYFVDIEFKSYSFPYTEVIAVERANVLLGRDVLNQLKLLLDGKSLSFDISDP